MNIERELGWNDSIENDNDFVLLEPGRYQFKVKKFERARHSGSTKLPPCNKAILTLEVFDEQDSTIITHNLYLHSKTEGMLCQFFKSIGARKHGEKVQMDWNKVTGATGFCKVKIDKFESNKEPGKFLESNKIDRFLDPEDEQKASSFTPGTF